MNVRSFLPGLVLVLAGCATTGPMTAKTKAPQPKVAHATGADEARALSQSNPREPYWPFRVAETCVARDSVAVAETWLLESLTRDPDYAPALSLRSRLLYEAGRHQEACEMLEESRSRQGSTFPGPLLAGLALHYEAMGDTDRLAAFLPTVPADVRAFLHLRLANDKQALEAARMAVSQSPESAICQNNVGLALLLAGEVEEARLAFETAVSLDPSLPGPYYNLAILERFYLVRDAEAAKWLARYEALSKEDPDGLFESRPGSLAGGESR